MLEERSIANLFLCRYRKRTSLWLTKQKHAGRREAGAIGVRHALSILLVKKLADMAAAHSHGGMPRLEHSSGNLDCRKVAERQGAGYAG